MNVLFVCTGNVCRSPMAEFFLRHEAHARDLPLRVRSTGTHAWGGRAATYEGRRIMAELGVSMDDHRTLELDADVVEWADLVIGLAFEHARDVVRAHPQGEGKTFTLKELLAVLDRLPAYDGDASGWVARAADAVREVEPPTDNDVQDPFGEREAAYRRVATEIRDLIEQLAAGLKTPDTARR